MRRAYQTCWCRTHERSAASVVHGRLHERHGAQQHHGSAGLRPARSQECDRGSQEWPRHIGSANMWRRRLSTDSGEGAAL
jgi:hypothetical protein